MATITKTILNSCNESNHTGKEIMDGNLESSGRV